MKRMCRRSGFAVMLVMSAGWALGGCGADEVVPPAIDAAPIDGEEYDAPTVIDAIDAPVADTSPLDSPLVGSCFFSLANVTLVEGATVNVAVVLTQQPQGPAVVTLTSDDVTACTATPTTLTFTPGNFSTPQTVTLTGVDDADTVNELVVITCTTPTAVASTLTVTLDDDDN